MREFTRGKMMMTTKRVNKRLNVKIQICKYKHLRIIWIASLKWLTLTRLISKKVKLIWHLVIWSKRCPIHLLLLNAQQLHLWLERRELGSNWKYQRVQRFNKSSQMRRQLKFKRASIKIHVLILCHKKWPFNQIKIQNIGVISKSNLR